VQFLLGSQVGLACSCDDELSVVNKATVVGVNGSEHIFDLLVRHDLTVVLKIANLDLFHRKFAVTVCVKGLENFGEVVTLLLAHQLGGNKRESGLLKSHVRLEFAKVVESGNSHSLVNLQSGKLCEPWVGKHVFGSGSFRGTISKQRSDEGLSVLRNRLPYAIFKGKLTLSNLFHDLLVCLSVERRLTREQDVGDDTTGPDVALVVVVLVKHLGSDVVGCA